MARPVEPEPLARPVEPAHPAPPVPRFAHPVLPLLVLLAVAGCSGDDDDDDDGSSTPGETPTATPASSPTPGPVTGDCAEDSSTVLRIHYQNESVKAQTSNYQNLYMWSWNAWAPEHDIQACGTDGFGAVIDVPRTDFEDQTASGPYMGFKFKANAGTDGPWYEFDRKWQPGVDPWEVWVVAGDATLYPDPASATLPRISSAWWDSGTEVVVTFSESLTGMGSKDNYSLDNGGQIVSVSLTGTTARLTTSILDIQTCYTLTFQSPEGPISNALFPRGVLDDYVSEEPLGSGVEEGATWFRIFAPRATEVLLHTSSSPTGGEDEVRLMSRDPLTGTWTTTIASDQHGLYYWYTVDGPGCRGEKFDPDVPLNDPWSVVALSSYTDDGRVVAGRSMVFNLEHLGAPTSIDRRPMQDLVAWEVHVRDLTGDEDSGLEPDDPAYRRFLGFTKKGLTGPNVGEIDVEGVPVCLPNDCFPVRTGLDHITELGVNAVQLLPVQEFPFDPDRFNWGYFTANFMSPEGSYATDETDETKLIEMKALIDALHAEGIAVVLDLVINHTAEGSDVGPAINFKGIDSKYYYRQDPFTYAYSNASGVGNDFATERPMARRYVLDVMAWWVEKMGVDGFRFDLAGLIDLETIEAIAERFPDIYLYGEPWAAGPALWYKGAVNDFDPWAVFNDVYRNTVKGSPEGGDRGFIQGVGNLEAVKAAITGSSVAYGGNSAWADAPTDSLNYLDAHDNLTLADKIEVSMSGVTVAEKEARVKLGGAVLLTSLGPVMMHAGVEFLRSKPYFEEGDGRPIDDPDSDAVFDANSYQSSDATNNLDWQLKADHYGVFQYWQGLIALRLGPLGLPTRLAGEVPDDYIEWHQDSSNTAALGYTLNADLSNGSRRLRVLLNASSTKRATFDVEFDGDGWWQVADGEGVDPGGMEAISGLQSIELPPLGILIYGEDPA